MADFLSSPQRKAQLLRFFAENGYQTVSFQTLATALDVSRATLYNNHIRPETLFEDLCEQVISEMQHFIRTFFSSEDDSCARIIKTLYISYLRALQQSEWANFICHFASRTGVFQRFLDSGGLFREILTMSLEGDGELDVREESIDSLCALGASALLGGIELIIANKQNWHQTFEQMSIHLLRAFGVEKRRAMQALSDINPVLKQVDIK